MRHFEPDNGATYRPLAALANGKKTWHNAKEEEAHLQRSDPEPISSLPSFPNKMGAFGMFSGRLLGGTIIYYWKRTRKRHSRNGPLGYRGHFYGLELPGQI